VATQRYPLHVELDGGKEWDIVADQRDVARWEIQPFGGAVLEAPAKYNTFARFLAWSASTRNNITDLTWDAFDKAAIEVNEVEDGKPDDEAGDPGDRAASDTP
jgi:hypothetical protein